MTRDLVKQSAKEIRKRNGFMAFICFFIAAILSASLLLLNIFFNELVFIIVPFLVLPILFSFSRAVIYLRTNTTLTASIFLSGIGTYFSERFRSTYSVLSEIWKLIIVYFATSMTATFVAYFIFNMTNFLSFRDMINEMLSLPYITIESMEVIINKYQTAYNAFMIVNYVPAAFLTAFMGLYFYSINSLSFFIRISGVKYPGSFIKKMFKYFKQKNYMRLNKKFLSLNWPLFLLFILGFVVGGYLGSQYRMDGNSIFTFGFSLAILLSFGIYGSIYFSNKEAIYYYFIDEIQSASLIIKKEVFDYLSILKASDEEVEEIKEEYFNEKDEEENKNDSNES